MSRSGAMDRIDALLGTVSDPAFVSVVRGEPLATFAHIVTLRA